MADPSGTGRTHPCGPPCGGPWPPRGGARPATAESAVGRTYATAAYATAPRPCGHRAHTRELARRHPAATVDPDVLYVDNGDILTSAGEAAAMDLCLHLVRLGHGSADANKTARRLITPPHRDGGQAQYIATPCPPPAATPGASSSPGHLSGWASR